MRERDTHTHTRTHAHITFEYAMMLCYVEEALLSNIVIDVSHYIDMAIPQTCAVAKGALSQYAKIVYRCRPGAIGRYLRIMMLTDQRRYLSLCEVEVRGVRGKICLNSVYVSLFGRE